jgi:RNA polymerase sigma factor (sigma-70 family)
VFRAEYGYCVATLVRVLGDIDLAEDAVQEAFAVAARRWPIEGLPPNPGGWIVTTARNRAVDRLRRDARGRELLGEVHALMPAAPPGPEEDTVTDDRLRLVFTCCHPALAVEARVALTLRLLGGLSTAEVARAFLVPEPTMAQRLVRAKRKIRAARIPYRVPFDHERPGGPQRPTTVPKPKQAPPPRPAEPPQPLPDGAVNGARLGLPPQPGGPNPPPPPLAPAPAVIAQQAIKSLGLRGPHVQLSANGSTFVGAPVWLWIDRGAQFTGPLSTTATAGAAQVTATGTLTAVEWDLGPPGAHIRCLGPGTPWTGQAGSSPDCGYTYTERSLPERTNGTGRWPVTATSVWQVTWTGTSAGASSSCRPGRSRCCAGGGPQRPGTRMLSSPLPSAACATPRTPTPISVRPSTPPATPGSPATSTARRLPHSWTWPASAPAPRPISWATPRSR